MSSRIILDLCGGTGSWSQPYKDVGYTVVKIDLPYDLRLLQYDPTWGVHGVLAAPPCTYFCRMRMCRGVPTDNQFREGLSVVDACLRVVTLYKPRWWALENPEGYLKRWLGPPQLVFQPWEYGDPWTKKTLLWGQFATPTKTPVQPKGPLVNSGHKRINGIAKNARDRAKTPPGFAKAFFKANP